MRQSLVALLLLAAASTVGSAQWHVDGQPVGDDKSHKVEDGFGAFLVLVPNPKDVISEVLHGWPGSVTRIPLAERVEPEEEVGAVVFLGGCRSDADGGCLTQVDFAVYGPDGMIYTELVGEPTPTEAPAEGHETQVSKTFLSVAFKATDRPGTYRVVAHVRDLTRNLSLDLETSVILEPKLESSGPRPN